MPITKHDTWAISEKACFAYLTDKIQDTEGVKAFVGSLPPQAYDCWYFELQGGGEEIDYELNMDTKGGCGEWMMNAQVVGRFAEREDAQMLGSILRSMLPTEENEIKGIFRFRPRSVPRLERDDTVDDGEGGMIPLTKITYELEVIIKES